MKTYQSEIMLGHKCSLCNGDVRFYCVESEPDTFDFWHYCTNPKCQNYHGQTEPVIVPKPEWIIKQ